MKKALVVLLLLAMVGGGLFAQSVTWSGMAEAGIGMTMMDGADDPVWGLNAYGAELSGMRSQVQVAAVNADGNAGVNVRVRAQGENVDGAFDGYTRLAYAEGWIKGFDGLLTLRGGKFATWDISSAYGSTFDGGYGLITYVNPLPMFSAGFGVKANPGVLNGLVFGDLSLWGAAKVDLGLALVTAHLLKAATTDASLSVSVSALPGFDIGAYATLETLDEFSDAGVMNFGASVGFSVAGLGIDVWGDFAQSNAESAKDPFIGVGAELSFPIGNVTPSLSVDYGMAAGDYSWGGLHAGFFNPTFNADQSILSIGPRVSIAVGKGTLMFGGVVNKDLNLAASGTEDEGMNIGAFVNLNVSF